VQQDLSKTEPMSDAGEQSAKRRLPLAEEERGSTYFPLDGARFAIPDDRPDLMLVELKTAKGPLRFSMSRMTALGFAKSIAEEAEKLQPDRLVK
jgi:hypothetical protein